MEPMRSMEHRPQEHPGERQPEPPYENEPLLTLQSTAENPLATPEYGGGPKHMEHEDLAPFPTGGCTCDGPCTCIQG